MRKIFIVLMLAIAGIAGAHAQDAAEKAFIQDFLKGMSEGQDFSPEEGLQFAGAFLEGKNVILSYTIDEAALFGGTPVKKAFAQAGMDEQTFGRMMRQNMFEEDMEVDEIETFMKLKRYGYKLYFRLIGSQSKEQMNCRVEYEFFMP